MKSDHDKLAIDVAKRVTDLLHNSCKLNAEACNLIFDRLTDILYLEDDKVLVDLMLGLSASKAVQDYIALDSVTGEQCQFNKPDALLYRRFV